ncbi:MAG: carnitine dehydratase [Deltaproteobacteria bacterium]|nr:MAG: carnitine dehydratase [Deltaproteobacteria bacterium]
MENALSGIKVLDFTTLLPGPYATLTLADLGAEVLRVSSPGRFDLVIESEPKIHDTRISANQAWLHRNKKTMDLNLKTDEAKDIVKKLIMEYDVVIEQFRPGVMDKLGLGYTALEQLNPRLIYCSLTGYGQTGPLKDRAGHDINYLSRSGLMSHAGKKGIGPTLMNFQIADIASGSLNAVVGILAAIHYRTASGKGQYVDIAMLDGLIPFNSLDGAGFLVDGNMPGMESGLLNGGSAYDFYETSDGKYMSVGSLEPKFWKEFCETLGHPEWIENTVAPPDIDSLKAGIRSAFLEKTQKQWQEIFDRGDCCVEPVLNLQDVFLEDEHIRQREMIVNVPMENGQTVPQYGMPVKLSKTPARYRHAGHEVGKDTIPILTDLGYTKEEIEGLTARGVLS